MGMINDLSDPELAVLLSTRASDNALSLAELAALVESPLHSVYETVSSLVSKRILEPIENYDGRIVYMYPDNDQAQAVFEIIHAGRSLLE
jgi:predicted transcriptional regulator